MKALIKYGFAVLILIFATSSRAADPPPQVSAVIAQQTQIALAAIEREIHAHLLNTHRVQLHETLPAELAATPLLNDAEPVAATVQAHGETRQVRVLTIVPRSGTTHERPALRWQSLLPGMMK